jgi:alpha-galactosidase
MNMRKTIVSIIISLAALFSAVGAAMAAPAVDVDKWIAARFARGVVPPFSFDYGGVHSDDLLPRWRWSATNLDAHDPAVTKRLFTWTDPATGLKVECEVKGFREYGAVEWVLRFQGGSAQNSRQISRVRVSDITLEHGGGKGAQGGDPVLHYADGSHVSKADFHQRRAVLSPGQSVHMEPVGGRSSSHAFPFFNVEFPSGRAGVMVAIGWTGTWFADIARSRPEVVDILSGMVNLDTWLQPGERIRTPSVCLLFWKGADRFAGHNAFRRFVLAHHTWKQNGRPTVYPISSSFNYGDPAPCNEYTCMTEDYAVAMIRRYEQYRLVPEVFWLDAGWYAKAAEVHNNRNWANSVGNWDIDSLRFPRGLKPIADEVHRVGAKFMVWFEPERVMKNSDWANRFPEWMLDSKGSVKQEEWQLDGSHDAVLFNLGNPEALNWLCRYMGDFMEKNGIDYYRQDFNTEPAGFWAANDTEGRHGICEIRYIEGLYAFWEYLLERFPEALVDNCASGGRRMDLEAISRSAAMWRTDYSYGEPTGYQCHTYGLELYLPLHGTGVEKTDSYTFRSSLGTSVIYNWKITDPANNILDMRARMAEFNEVRPYFLEDYYPLSGSGDVDITVPGIWMAYQLHRPSDDSGYVVAFRREGSPDPVYVVRLHSLKADQTYVLTDKDTGAETEKTGHELMTGLELRLDQPRKGMLLKFKRATEKR